MIKKSVKLCKIARHLVKHCSLFSWFSSLISVTREGLIGDENRFFLKHVLAVLKVSTILSVSLQFLLDGTRSSIPLPGLHHLFCFSGFICKCFPDFPFECIGGLSTLRLESLRVFDQSYSLSLVLPSVTLHAFT